MNILKVKRKKASVAVHLVAVRDKNKTSFKYTYIFQELFPRDEDCSLDSSRHCSMVPL